MPLKIALIIIDPQNDFMGKDDGSPYSVQYMGNRTLQAQLPVAGALSDMKRLATMIDRVGRHLAEIRVTLDSHHPIDVSHPGMWRDQNGDPPPPFTIITPADIANGTWRAVRPDLQDRLRSYVQKLNDQGNYPLCIWPEHCLIGSWGNNVQQDVAEALYRWERQRLSTVHYVAKGTNCFTEHFGALMAEVEDPEDPATALNTEFLDMMQNADIVAIAGEASSHCVLETVKQIATNIGDNHVRKFQVLTDCMSPVAAIPGQDFPAIAKAFFGSMQQKGMTLTTSVKFLA